MGLGSARDLSLALARREAARAREALILGQRPLDLKQAAAAQRRTEHVANRPDRGITFGAAADSYFARMSPTWRNKKHIAQFNAAFRLHAASLLRRPVRDVTTEDVRAVLQPIWLTKAETASRIRGRIERVLDFARVEGHRDGENPARWNGHLSQILPPRKKTGRGHFAALPFEQLPGFIVRLAKAATVASRALEFTILVAARSCETLGAKWAEFDLDNGVWLVPAERMKAHREHRVPLSARAVEIVREMRKTATGDYVFAARKSDSKLPGPLSTMAMAMALRRLDEKVTVHGFRSTFRDWVSEQTDYPREVAEMALAHAISNRVEAAYRRGDLFEKRRALMDDWATFCASGDELEAMLG